MNKLLSFIFLVAISFFLVSCVDDELAANADLQLNFKHQSNAVSFEYGKSFENAAGNSFSVQLWRTYISDIILTTQEGNAVHIQDSYHLIEPQQSNLDSVVLVAVPHGVYTQIAFNIGVPEEANLSETLVGDLDPSNNMAWNWVKGYKFIRVDGEFFDVDNNRRGVIVHIGTEDNLKKLHFDLAEPLVIKGVDQSIDFKVNINALFEQPNIINFEEVNDFQFNAETNLISKNYEEGYIYLADN